jgi:hypothetical protein
LEKALVSAQIQADEIRANAHKESELILRDAELKARSIVNDSYAETQRVQQALVQLKHLEEDFRFKFRSLLQGHLRLLEEVSLVVPASDSATGEVAPTGGEPAGGAETGPLGETAAVQGVAGSYGGSRSIAPYPDGGASALEVTTPAVAAGGAQLASPGGSLSLTETGGSTQAPSDVETGAAPRSETSESGETETLEQTLMFGDSGKLAAESGKSLEEAFAEADTDEDPLAGFFLGGKSEAADDTTPRVDREADRRDARDFEW